ncbi:MAG: hypothetical protein C0600_04005 [Ignavibacteria bacterium]|nr:MAG: hypothetical protein C0600_04005 [Ignavibacteria bacterium]
MRWIIIPLMLLALVTGCETEPDPNPANDILGVPVLECMIPQERYVELLSNRWSDEEAAVDIFVGGERFRGSFEPQGAGSRFHIRWSFKLEVEKEPYPFGLVESNLSAQIFDDSRLRTALASYVFGELGFPLFDFHPIYLKINGRNYGLYILNERFDTPWFEKRQVPVHELIKADFGSVFTYRNGLQLAKYFRKIVPDDDNVNGMGDLIHALDQARPEHIIEDVGTFLDIENYLRYHAASSVLNHVDGFSNNLFFYKAHPGDPYSIIPWDFDKLMYESSDAGLVGPNDIIFKLLQNDTCVAIYKREIRHVIDDVLDPEKVFPVLDAFAARIVEAHAADPYLGEAGISLEVESNRLKENLMKRRTFFRNNLETITRFPR